MPVIGVGKFSMRVYPRTLITVAVLLIATLGISVMNLMHGSLGLGIDEVWKALQGEGSAAAVRSVQSRRLPRLVTALGVGGGLGVAGAVFQSLSRNALGSPDIIGLTTGAALGAVIQILLFGGGVLPTAIAAIIGGVLTAIAVYALARRDGTTGGLRLILVGIGAGALLSAAMSFLLVRADINDAAVVQQWTSGSLTGRGWPHAWSVVIALAVLLPPLVIVSRKISVMEMGDDAAAGLGISVERSRFIAIILAVAMTGAATAATGPIAFIALAAPQIARRLIRRGEILIAGSFFLGALLLAAADLLSQSVEIGLRTPVGLVTSLLGGIYLIWLLAKRRDG